MPYDVEIEIRHIINLIICLPKIVEKNTNEGSLYQIDHAF